jgi:hypothetical protein
MYVQKLVFDPVRPAKEAPTALKTRTRAERNAARVEMAKLSERIFAGFRSRSKYHQPRKATPEPWREFLREPDTDLTQEGREV